jgi:hypothetical protein
VGLILLVAAGLYLGRATGNALSPWVGVALLVAVAVALFARRARRRSKRPPSA